jgi:hypothetical protein
MSKLFTLIVVVAVAAGALVAFTAAINAQNEDGNNGDTSLGFTANLSGAQEVPTVDTIPLAEKGEVEAKFDEGFTQVEVRLQVRGNLEGTTVQGAHFHCGRPGENGPIALGLFDPGNLTFDPDSGVAEGVLTNDDFTGANCVEDDEGNEIIGRPVNNIVALAFAMDDGLIYANVHTDANPGGEIRGQMLEE